MKCIRVSGSSLHKGHWSLILLPTMGEVVSGYRCTSRSALTVACSMAKGEPRPLQMGCILSVLHCCMFTYDNEHFSSASFCSFWVHLLCTAFLTINFQSCFDGGFSRSSDACGRWYFVVVSLHVLSSLLIPYSLLLADEWEALWCKPMGHNHYL